MNLAFVGRVLEKEKAALRLGGPPLLGPMGDALDGLIRRLKVSWGRFFRQARPTAFAHSNRPRLLYNYNTLSVGLLTLHFMCLQEFYSNEQKVSYRGMIVNYASIHPADSPRLSLAARWSPARRLLGNGTQTNATHRVCSHHYHHCSRPPDLTGPARQRTLLLEQVAIPKALQQQP